MEKPFYNVYMPIKSEYEERTREVVIFKSFDVINEFDYDEDEAYKYNEDNEDDDPIVPLRDMNLQMILDKVPAGVNLSDIKMEVNLSLNDMGTNPTDRKSIKFYYIKTFPADLEKYKKDLAEYNKGLKEYEKKRKAYDKWVKNQEIKELQERIKELKK